MEKAPRGISNGEIIVMYTRYIMVNEDHLTYEGTTEYAFLVDQINEYLKDIS